MTKRTLLITALALTYGAQADAQKTAKDLLFGKHKLDAITQGILSKQAPQQAQRGTAVAERLIASNIKDVDATDSASYKYNTTSRGSLLDNNVFGTYLEHGYNPGYDEAQPYPIAVARSRVSLKYDTAYYQSVENSVVTSRTYISRGFTAANALTTEYTYMDQLSNGSQSLSNMRTNNTYDAATNLTSSKTYQDTSANLNGQFAPSSSYFFTYGTAGVVKDSSIDFGSGRAVPSYRTAYTYDGTGNLTLAQRQMFLGNTYNDYSRNIYTYANNKLHTHLSQYENNGTWTNYLVDTFSYTGNNLTHSSYYFWDDNTGMWSDGEVTNSYFNAQNNIDSQYTYYVQANTPEPDSKLKFTYNSFGHFNTIKGYYYDAGSFSTTPDVDVTFYYETFTPTAINTPVLANSGISLYPNPANDVLNIRFKDAPKGAVNVRIYNAIGQLMEQASLGTSGNGLPISRLAPGNYIAEVTDGAASQRLTFVKQ